MNATIKTLDIVVGDKTVPLSKSIVNQLEWLDGSKYNKNQVQPLGTVSLPDSLLTIFETPDGLQRSSANYDHVYGKLPRIILTK